MAKPKKPHLYAFYRPHERTPTVFEGETRTKTDQAKAANVNHIVAQYDRTGVIKNLQRAEGVFADVSEIGSYQDAVQQVQRAQESFLELPAALRARFENDPTAYLDWATQAPPEAKEALFAEITGNVVEDPKEAVPNPPPASPPAEAE